LTLKEMESKGGKINPIIAIVLRYLRLTPSLALAMLIFYKILAFMGNGPFAPQFQQSINSRCDGSWWSELIYLMNFVPFDSDKVCMGWTWYLGDDMIFFIVGIFLIPVYYRKQWAGWFLGLLIIAASLTVTCYLIAHYNLGAYAFDINYQKYSYYAYSKPYCRIGAYLVGVMAAWVLAGMEKRGVTRDSLRTRPYRHLVTLIVLSVTGILAFLVFIPHTDFGLQKDDWNTLENVLYLNFGRILWAICLAVITLACYYDHLPWTNGLLSHELWTPFTRLTYGAYLCHPLIIKLTAGNEFQFYQFSGEDLTLRCIANVVLAYAASLGLWCLIERPTMTLSTSMLKSGKHTTQTRKQEGQGA